ncbi:chorismate lyase [Pseudocolwellia sp. AS88]|uniref:chorismate--pyruvate lyase family protein n=1 Tax=Pseudocolwellia sp. AS88 TaxID=3063958 RepID=UPI0026EC53ED|nr:chorismate lyase [Pseudocolwellia sp. AS88]MDO7083950.1 chorismate lyase [Pseudocolwellia sp. AS88]
MKHHSHLFPVTLQTLWSSSVNTDNDSVHEGLRDWLFATGSLTARLKTHCTEFRVEVLGQEIIACSELEANDDIAVDEQVLVREVLLYCDNKPQVFARSLLPLKSLTGEEQSLAKLGEQPLGQVLFNHPDLIRKGIEVACFKQSSALFTLIKQLDLPTTAVWGRRSVFVLNNKPIMVAEVFLPESFAYELISETRAAQLIE